MSLFLQLTVFQVARVNIIRDPRTGDCRGFGFVYLENPDDVDDVAKKMDGTEIDGRKIVAEKVIFTTLKKPTISNNEQVSTFQPDFQTQLKFTHPSRTTLTSLSTSSQSAPLIGTL